MTWKALSKAQSQGCSAALGGAGGGPGGAMGRAAEVQVTAGANPMQGIYLEGAEGSVARMSQLFK